MRAIDVALSTQARVMRRSLLVDAMHTMVWVFAGEISGEIPLRAAPDYLGAAVLGYSGDIEKPKPDVTDFEEANESSPDVRLLRGFWRTAELADSVVPLDPDAIRREVFGEERQALSAFRLDHPCAQQNGK